MLVQITQTTINANYVYAVFKFSEYVYHKSIFRVTIEREPTPYYCEHREYPSTYSQWASGLFIYKLACYQHIGIKLNLSYRYTFLSNCHLHGGLVTTGFIALIFF